MILEKTLYDVLFWFCILVGMLLTICLGNLIRDKKNSNGLKNIVANYCWCALLIAFCMFILYWCLYFLINLFVCYGATEIREIVREDGSYKIVTKYYFDRSKIPSGYDADVLNEKGIHYYNGTDKEIAYFSRKYYSKLLLKWQQKSKKMREDIVEKPLDLIHITDARVEYDTVSGVIIKPLLFFNMTRAVNCAFKPSPTSIAVTRSKKSGYHAFDSDSITIMDLKDSLISHHGVVIRTYQ